jgi:hypothetical protein
VKPHVVFIRPGELGFHEHREWIMYLGIGGKKFFVLSLGGRLGVHGPSQLSFRWAWVEEE